MQGHVRGELSQSDHDTARCLVHSRIYAIAQGQSLTSLQMSSSQEKLYTVYDGAYKRSEAEYSFEE